MKARRKFRHAKTHAVGWSLVVASAIAVTLAIGACIGVWNAIGKWTQNLPSLNNTDTFNFAQQSYMYAADGTTLLAEFQLEKRDPVEKSDISRYVLEGTVATEDLRFYEHNGVDPWGIARALYSNLAGRQLEGASTITQQLVRNTVLSEEANNITIERKVREAALALEMEKKYSKDEILNLYLNVINYGDGCYGIEAAAQNYFQTSAADLSITQAATLVGIPQSPNQLNPKEHPDECLARRNVVLSRMLKAGVITDDEYKSALSEDLGLNPKAAAPFQGIYAYPYFTSHVRNQLLAEGNQYDCSYADLFEGGLTIYTTLDTTLQDKADEACAQQYASMSSDLDASLVAMDPKNGHVLAMVGGKDYYTDQWNIATQGGRPAGSSFKVFTLIGALQAGISPSTVIDCTDPYTLPNGDKLHNFDSINYGKRSISSATAVSSNTGYYRLIEKVGTDKVIDIAHSMGVNQDLPSYPIITLGTENVTPLEMATAYNTLAAQGVKRDPVIITKIVNSEGKVIYEAKDKGERVLSEEIAGATTKVLRGVFETREGTAYGYSPANGQKVAGKTGTGTEFRDHWLVGYCPTLTCSVWIGNRDYSTTSPSLTASPLWKNFMSKALEGQPVVPFPTVADPPYANTPKPTDQKSSESKTDSEKESEDNKDIDESIQGADPATAPSVVGMNLSDALSSLSSYWIVYTQVKSSEPAGKVISQSIDGKAVSLVVSAGS
ncbi:glycosyl transferase [Berryella intestinalis]|uniref:Glycosyl transferase n=1 Tax=Berryella intestinalis TaxID=1531429 RepID=A0A0A8B577_9ACTN|nr:glycosyl transferase [Berryella intestinalis]